MNIKEKIGQRIKEERLAKGFTLKNLEELTDDLKVSRICNWERGDRTPGPEEIKQLATALDISPAYLMCLTDEKQPKKIPGLGALIPLLDHQQASDLTAFIEAIKNEQALESINFVPISAELSVRLGDYAFALKMTNESMVPEMRINDIQIIDPSSSPNPGDYVVVKICSTNEVIVCQYKKLSYTSPEFELLTLNDNWPNITVNESVRVEIIGKVVQNIRIYL